MIIKEEKNIWKKALLKNDSTIRRAIENLNKSSLQIILVVSKNNKLTSIIHQCSQSFTMDIPLYVML